MALDFKRRKQHLRKHSGRQLIVILTLVGCIVLGAGVFYLSSANNITPPETITNLPSMTKGPSTANIDPNAYANISLTGKAAIVYDLTDGKTLYAKNANTPLPLASVTKLLTLYAASYVLQPDSVVTITPQALTQKGDEADAIFYTGESFHFEDIARLTLAASSNVGAEAIAEAAAAAKNTDVDSLLSNAAQQAGLAQTRPSSATGLDISATASGSYGSAHDVAVLAGELLKKNPQVAAATTQAEVSIRALNRGMHKFDNTDTYVTKYPGLLLSKTGYTGLAGGNLVIVADIGANHPIAIVTLGSTVNDRFTDVSQLLKATLAHFGK